MFELLCELQTICDDIFYGCGFSKKKKVCGRRFTLSCLTLGPNLLSSAHFMLQLAQI